MFSLGFSDHYFELGTLHEVGRRIKMGNRPQLDEAARSKLSPAVREAKTMLGMDRLHKDTPTPTPLWRRAARLLFGPKRLDAKNPNLRTSRNSNSKDAESLAAANYDGAAGTQDGGATLVDEFELGRMLARIMLDPDDCWRDVCKLRDYEVSDQVATCEMAFVRAAIMKEAVDRTESGDVAKAIAAGVDKFVYDAFEGEKESEEVLKHYDNKRLVTIAREIMDSYAQYAFLPTQLADIFANRLSIAGFPSVEIAPLFQEVSAETERLLVFSRSARKTRAALDWVKSGEAFRESIDRQGSRQKP
jgi:hypothetical protein